MTNSGKLRCGEISMRTFPQMDGCTTIQSSSVNGTAYIYLRSAWPSGVLAWAQPRRIPRNRTHAQKRNLITVQATAGSKYHSGRSASFTGDSCTDGFTASTSRRDGKTVGAVHRMRYLTANFDHNKLIPYFDALYSAPENRTIWW